MERKAVRKGTFAKELQSSSGQTTAQLKAALQGTDLLAKRGPSTGQRP